MGVFSVWHPRLSVNIREIDNQHRKLLELINTLHTKIEGNDTREVLQEVMDELAQYSIVHFDTEESLMEQYGFPETEAHKEEHEEFKEEVRELLEDLQNERLTMPNRVSLFIKSWIMRHIEGTDKKYSRFFNSKGVY